MISAFFALLALSVKLVGGHPQCVTNSRPPDADQTELTFCPSEQFGGDDFLQYGSCCTELEEAVVETKFFDTSLLAPGGQLSTECADLYKELVCTQCHSFSSHIFERLGAEFGPFDGMTLKQDFCEALVLACDGQVAFGGEAEYGISYCEQHVGGDTDQYWSYPYTDPPILEPGLNLVFPNIVRTDIPFLAITIRLTPDASEYWIASIEGKISKILAADRDTNQISDVVDISDIEIFYVDYEEGLLDLAFDPKFSDNKFFYLSYTINLGDLVDVDQFNRISRFTNVPGSATAILASEVVLLTSAMKFNSVHSAGWLGFKPSAYASPGNFNDLYWTTGDGGPQTDPYGASQDTTNLLGSMMRISVPAFEGYISDTDKPYDIPAGNYQDVDTSAAPEVCAIGFRNPWRCSFDRLDDTLWCGDVGQSSVESIYIVECGKNYGWPRFEGSSCFVPDSVEGVPDAVCSGSTDRSGFEFPVYQYCHPDYQSTDPDTNGGVDFCADREIEGFSVIGGFVYRGNYFSDLIYGAYIFADNENRNVYFIKQTEDGEWASGTIISDGSAWIVSMAEDESGEIFLLTRNRAVYYLPCGDLCSTTCLAQGEEEPTTEPLGCFADSASNRALTLDAPSLCGVGEQYMSPQICASYCSTVPNAVYAGVEGGIDCYCGAAGEDFGKNGPLGEESCQSLCESNPESTCGGIDAIEVFELGPPVSPFTPAPGLVIPTLPPGTGEPSGTAAPSETVEPVTPAPLTTATPSPAVGPTPAPVADGQTCPGGIPGIPSGNGEVCCTISCINCGGTGCHAFPGGQGSCCIGGSNGILANAGDCATTGTAPCVLGDEPATPAPLTSATPAPAVGPTTAPVAEPATPVPLAVATPAPAPSPSEPATPAPLTTATPSPAVGPTPAPVADGQTCPGGIPGIPSGNGEVCCTISCINCGGTGCHAFPGGQGSCCIGGSNGILANAGDCATTGTAPCVLGDEPATPAPLTSATPAPAVGPTTAPVAEPATPVPLAAATPAPAPSLSEPTTPAPLTAATPSPAVGPTPAPVAGGDTCPGGIPGIPSGNGEVCCATSCINCGGTGCHAFPGGQGNCCIGGSNGILANAGDCATTGAAPCVLGDGS